MWKESGSPLSFKDWFQQELNKSVQETIDSVNKTTYLNADGGTSEEVNDPSKNYQPNLTGKTILGINKNIVYAAGGIVIVYCCYKMYTTLNGKIV